MAEFVRTCIVIILKPSSDLVLTVQTAELMIVLTKKAMDSLTHTSMNILSLVSDIYVFIKIRHICCCVDITIYMEISKINSLDE